MCLRGFVRALGERLGLCLPPIPPMEARPHPGATLISRAAEAAGQTGGGSGKCTTFSMRQEPPLTEKPCARIRAGARARHRALPPVILQARRDKRTASRKDLAEGKRQRCDRDPPPSSVDGIRYDGAWDFLFHAGGLGAPPSPQRVQRSARVFASLPASGGLVLLLAAASGAFLLFANSPLGALLPALHRLQFRHRACPGSFAVPIGRGVVLRGPARNTSLSLLCRARDPARDDRQARSPIAEPRFCCPWLPRSAAYLRRRRSIWS